MGYSNNVCKAGNKAHLHFFIIIPNISSGPPADDDDYLSIALSISCSVIEILRSCAWDTNGYEDTDGAVDYDGDMETGGPEDTVGSDNVVHFRPFLHI